MNKLNYLANLNDLRKVAITTGQPLMIDTSDGYIWVGKSPTREIYGYDYENSTIFNLFYVAQYGGYDIEHGLSLWKVVCSIEKDDTLEMALNRVRSK